MVAAVGVVVSAEAQELFGSREPVVGLEAVEVSVHDVDEESDGGLAAFGLEPYEVGELLVEGSVRRRGGQIQVVGVRGAGALGVAVAVVGGEAVPGDIDARVVHAELE